MKFKSLLILFSIFLLLSLPFVASAASGNTTKKTTELSEDYLKRLDKYEEEKESKSVKVSDDDPDDKKEEPTTTTTTTDMNAGTLMIENAWYGILGGTSDRLLEGGFKIASVGVEENVTGSKTLKYSLYATELDPFSTHFVESFLQTCEKIYYAVSIILLCMAYWAFLFQNTTPGLFSTIRESITGKEEYFDFKSMAAIWVYILLGPKIQYYFMKVVLVVRNYVNLGLTTRMVEAVGTSSDSLPTYFLTCLGWYIGALQKITGEFGVYFIASLLYVTCAVTVLLAVYVSKSAAIKIGFVVNLYFILFVLMDIITLVCIYFGVEMCTSKGSWVYVIPGMFMGIIVDALIIILPTLVIIILLYKTPSRKWF